MAESDPEYMNIYTFNEWKEKPTWQKKIDGHLTSIHTSELTDNAFRVHRWMIQCLLADVDLIKFNFVSRVKKNPSKHHLLATTTAKVKDLVQQLAFNAQQAWGNLEYVIDLFSSKLSQDGDFLLAKYGETQNLKIHKIEKRDVDDEGFGDDANQDE